MEAAFLSLYEQFILEKPLKNTANLLDVHLEGGRENTNIIKINENKNIEHVSKDVIDQHLKDSGGVYKTERENAIFKCPRGELNAIFHSSPSLMRIK